MILIAVAILVFWPNGKHFEVVSIKRMPNFGVRSSGSNIGFNGTYTAELQLSNPGYIGWNFELIETKMSDKESKKKLGSGSVADVTIPRKQTQNITMPIAISYAGSGDNDEVVSRFAHICDQPRQEMEVELTTEISNKAISWIYKPVIKRDIKLACTE
ncbi:hypothetical protein THASP1DRAFT_26454 [Thamnocephalis sphaerospora]|uniref:Late embryogenesis abundant protein LEA-2 subgroup domain-containing protein n=1 Tax=Thamnocephalis sphaerospora TaxID=78915 RepID=A0A4P9XH86_9FUNG|nr:hypothetical protein THASP1DRAFT_26454 [Thamnocephalis sphaerospora]|eukprot:RKP04988.1 hypothetical protein THASP1DRAFT_26454 [Thamnocephalis sphaerospora]